VDGEGAGGSTIHDVARAAKVSSSTVSRVLNGRASKVSISQATVDRVREAAAALHYRPNASARSLRTAKTQAIGVIAQDLMAPFSPEFLRVITAACHERGYHVLVGHAAFNTSEGLALSGILSSDRVDGILLLGDVLSSAVSQQEMAEFVRQHRHVVTVGCSPRQAGEVSISVDNTRGVTMALEYLYEMGHRAIGYVGSHRPPRSWEEEQRWNAYCHFVETHRLPAGEAYAANIPFDLEVAPSMLDELLRAPIRPSAIFVSNDLAALVILKAALTLGLHVPGDLSLVGFDDLPIAALSTPGLTTVKQPIEEMGRYAVSILLDKVTGTTTVTAPADSSPGVPSLIFPPTLVCRQSVRPCHLYVTDVAT
jgi:LacI family transcriptional regulator